MERQFFDCDCQDNLTVEYYLSRLSFAVIGMILRGSEHDEKIQNMDEGTELSETDKTKSKVA